MTSVSTKQHTPGTRSIATIEYCAQQQYTVHPQRLTFSALFFVPNIQSSAQTPGSRTGSTKRVACTAGRQQTSCGKSAFATRSFAELFQIPALCRPTAHRAQHTEPWYALAGLFWRGSQLSWQSFWYGMSRHLQISNTALTNLSRYLEQRNLLVTVKSTTAIRFTIFFLGTGISL